jgi:rod shape-determining protein MreC
MVVQRRETRPRSVLFIAIFTSLLLVIVDSRGNGVIDSFRSVARDVIAPVQDVVNSAFNPVRDLFSSVTDFGSLKAENARLKRELDAARGKLERERAVGTQVGELEKLLDLPTIQDATGVAARVIGGAPGNFERSVQINKGTGQGVDVGQPVVAGAGLVGKITQASSTRATVTLIDSPSLSVGVRLEKSQVRGLAEGKTGERDLHLSFLQKPLGKCQANASPDTCITKGELVFTSAVSGAVFPPDVPVATVTSITKKISDLESTITLQPLVSLDDLTYVKVLRLASQTAPSQSTTNATTNSTKKTTTSTTGSATTTSTTSPTTSTTKKKSTTSTTKTKSTTSTTTGL